MNAKVRTAPMGAGKGDLWDKGIRLEPDLNSEQERPL